MNVFLFLLGMPGGAEWIIILVVVLLIFGSTKLPQLAKALGQSKKAFKDGIAEAEEDEKLGKGAKDSASLTSAEDEELLEEARRRTRLRVSEGKND